MFETYLIFSSQITSINKNLWRNYSTLMSLHRPIYPKLRACVSCHQRMRVWMDEWWRVSALSGQTKKMLHILILYICVFIIFLLFSHVSTVWPTVKLNCFIESTAQLRVHLVLSYGVPEQDTQPLTAPWAKCNHGLKTQCKLFWIM